jgi:hypothetical protein
MNKKKPDPSLEKALGLSDIFSKPAILKVARDDLLAKHRDHEANVIRMLRDLRRTRNLDYKQDLTALHFPERPVPEKLDPLIKIHYVAMPGSSN